MSHLEGSERTTWLCIYVPSSLSLAASVWMLTSYALFPKLQTPTIRLVMLESIIQVLYALVYNVGFYNVPPSDTFACALQGWGIVFTVHCSVLLTAAIAGYMVLTIEKKQRITLTYTRLALLFSAVLIISGALATIPLLFDQYANLGARCWIAEDEDGRNRQTGNILRFTVYYDVIWLCITFIVISYYKVTRYLRLTNSFRTTMAASSTTNSRPGSANQTPTSSTDASTNPLSVDRIEDGSGTKKTAPLNSHAKFVHRTISVLLMYPVICICAWAPITLLRIINAVDPSYVPSEAFLGVCMAAASSQGICFGLVFWKYRSVNTEWKRFFRLCYSKFRRTLFAMGGNNPSSSEGSANSTTDNESSEYKDGAAALKVDGTDVVRSKDSTLLLSAGDEGPKIYSDNSYSQYDDASEYHGAGNSIDGSRALFSSPADDANKEIGLFSTFRRMIYGNRKNRWNESSSKSDLRVHLTSPPTAKQTSMAGGDNRRSGNAAAMRSQAPSSAPSSRMRLSDSINHFTSMVDMELPEDGDDDDYDESGPGMASWEAGARNVHILTHQAAPQRTGGEYSNEYIERRSSIDHNRRSSFADSSGVEMR